MMTWKIENCQMISAGLELPTSRLTCLHLISITITQNREFEPSWYQKPHLTSMFEGNHRLNNMYLELVHYLCVLRCTQLFINQSIKQTNNQSTKSTMWIDILEVTKLRCYSHNFSTYGSCVWWGCLRLRGQGYSDLLEGQGSRIKGEGLPEG